MQSARIFNQITTDGHLCFVYKNTLERAELLAEYFTQGIANNELCIFVTSDSQDQAIKGLKAAKFNPTKAIERGYLHIFEMESTYLPHGKFAKDFMMENVVNFMKDATAQGYNGLRTAGEMGWVSDHPEAVEDAIAYEAAVNTLNSPQPRFVGLCLYSAHKTLARVLEGALETHPTIVQDKQPVPNFAYQPAAS